MDKFNKHEVIWTEEKINNFWNYFVTNHGLLGLSFAKETGRDIIKRARKYLRKDGNNLDYGCGAGYFMGYLFEKGISCQGLDASKESLSEVKKKYNDHKFFKGTILASGLPHNNIQDNTYNFVFSIETIEHLIVKQLPEILKEIYRIIKPGGHIFVSTPNNENLDKYKVICPDCGAVFHRVQHVNSFTKESLSRIMADIGFEKIFCKSVLLKHPENIIDRMKSVFNYLEAKILNKKRYTPHLIYLGKKR